MSRSTELFATAICGVLLLARPSLAQQAPEPGGTRTITLTANPPELTTGHNTELRAQVSDGRPDVNITFTGQGMIPSIQTTDSDGVALYLVHAENPAEVTVTASADGYTSGSTVVKIKPAACICCSWCTQ